MDWIARNFDAVEGLLCFAGLCAPAVGIGLGLGLTRALRALLAVRSQSRTKTANASTGPLPVPWLVAQAAFAGVAIAVVGKVLASYQELPFTPWGFLATCAGLTALVITVMFTGTGIDKIQAATLRATNRNLLVSLAGLVAGGLLGAIILALWAA